MSLRRIGDANDALFIDAKTLLCVVCGHGDPWGSEPERRRTEKTIPPLCGHYDSLYKQQQ